MPATRLKVFCRRVAPHALFWGLGRSYNSFYFCIRTRSIPPASRNTRGEWAAGAMLCAVSGWEQNEAIFDRGGALLGGVQATHNSLCLTFYEGILSLRRSGLMVDLSEHCSRI